jgi:hypothetical protein
MISGKIICITKKQAEQEKANYLQQYHPAGYGTEVKISNRQYGVVYQVKVKEQDCEWSLADIDKDKIFEAIKNRMFYCYAKRKLNITWEESKRDYWTVSYSRLSSCD